MRKSVIKNTKEDTWQRLIHFYKWSFSIFFLVFAGVLLSEQVYLMCIGFLILTFAFIPISCVRKIEKYVSMKWFIVLAIGMIFYAFHLIAGG